MLAAIMVMLSDISASQLDDGVCIVLGSLTQLS